MKSRSSAWATAVLLTGAVVVMALPGGQVAADDKIPFPLATLGVAPAAPKPVGANFLLADTSRLPYPIGAERWVDARGDTPVTVNVPGAGATTIQRQAALVYRPQGDHMRWEDLSAMYAKAGILAADAQPKLNLLKVPDAPGGGTPTGNAFEDRVYDTHVPGEHLALGLIRNLQSQHLLVYQMLISSKLNDAQALLYSRNTVENLAEEARVQRMRLPGPAGATSVGPVIQLRGPQIRQLQTALAQDEAVSPEVRRMASIVLPQATSVTRAVWRTPSPLGDKEFVEFYLGQARQRGYSAPVSRDESHSGRPTLLFQRPYNSGVTLVRAQPTPSNGNSSLGSTTVYIFEMDGAINVDALTSK